MDGCQNGVREVHCFYSAKHERGHWGNTIDVCLTNGLVSNHEYSNGDGYVINSMESAYGLMRVVVVL